MSKYTDVHLGPLAPEQKSALCIGQLKKPAIKIMNISSTFMKPETKNREKTEEGGKRREIELSYANGTPTNSLLHMDSNLLLLIF